MTSPYLPSSGCVIEEENDKANVARFEQLNKW